jgi:hypothetical protein
MSQVASIPQEATIASRYGKFAEVNRFKAPPHTIAIPTLNVKRKR